MQDPFLPVPWASGGDTTVIPTPSQPSGFASWVQGWGPDYQLDPVIDPLNYKPVERAVMNAVLNILSSLATTQQRQTWPEFIDATANGGVGFPYAIGATVRYFTPGTPGSWDAWVNLVNNNATTPSVANGWIKYITAITAIDQIQQATTTIVGVTRYATSAEVRAGTEASAATTPLSLANAIFALSKNWVDVTSTRFIGATFTNTSDYAKAVAVTVGVDNTAGVKWMNARVNGAIVQSTMVTSTGGGSLQLPCSLFMVVPPGATYRVEFSTLPTGTSPVTSWMEL